MFTQYDYDNKRVLIDYISKFYDDELSEFLDKIENNKRTAKEYARLIELTEDLSVKTKLNILRKSMYDKNNSYMNNSEIFRYKEKSEFVKKVLAQSYKFYDGNLEKLKKRIWVYASY